VNQLTRLLEAALFSAAHPLGIDELKVLDPGSTPEEIRAALDELRDIYQNGGHGIELVELADGFQVMTRREFADAIAMAQIIQRPRKLSAAAMETLAIIAYRQPVGRAEIEDIRGVAAEGVLRLLQERGLIDVVGRSEGLGRPLLYATTPSFLEMLGLKDLSELPRAEELSVALRPPEPVQEL
jgi:segregation and condensation protein B